MEEAPMVSGGGTPVLGGFFRVRLGGPMMGEPIKSKNSTLL